MPNDFDKVSKLAHTNFGSEDDLIVKVVIPFFELLGYKNDSYEIKFPVSGYRPGRPGRNPEGDCVFFANKEHNLKTSLFVVEAKRDDKFPPELQARFYSTNLFTPFYIAWSELTFEVWQVQNFREPSLIGQYELDKLSFSEFSTLKDILSSNHIISFCEKHEIKKFDLDELRREAESKYLARLLTDLRSYKALDLPTIFNFEKHYVPISVTEADSILSKSISKEMDKSTHPNSLEKNLLQNCQAFSLPSLLRNNTAIALIGDPGVGKTSMLRHLCLENCYGDSQWFPVYISVAKMVALDYNLKEMISHQIGSYSVTESPGYLLDALLSEGRLLLCLDGIDELDNPDPMVARSIIRKISSNLTEILERHTENTVVVSARRESWQTCRPLLPQLLKEFIVRPLPLSDVRTFIDRWLSEYPIKADALIDALRRRGWPSFATNPLLLTLTCIVFLRRGEFPSKMSELYERFIEIMLEEWNETRRISRRIPVPGLTTENAIFLLSELALAFHEQRRGVFTRVEALHVLSKHMSSAGLSSVSPEEVFIELIDQHGLIRSWSIDEYFAFPHLSFQAFLAAKALRSQNDAYLSITQVIDDAFWQEAILLYAELGDITDFVQELLSDKENILHTSLFIVANCLATGATIADPDIRQKFLKRLEILSNENINYLSEKAIHIMSQIDHPEVIALLTPMIYSESKSSRPNGPARKYIVKILGEDKINTVIEELVKHGDDEDLLANFEWLPRKKAIENLEALILRCDWPNEKELGYDPGIRHIRRDAAHLLAKIGEEAAIPSLKRLLHEDILNDFEKAGVVTALGSIDVPEIPALLRNFLTSDLPVDCQIEAAKHLGPHDLIAKHFLFSILQDKNADYFDRRDAASALTAFTLIDDELVAFKALIFDPDPKFWGGPSVAAETVAKVGSEASCDLLNEALIFWESSGHPDASLIKAAISAGLSLRFDVGDLRVHLEKGLGPHYGNPIEWRLPEIAEEYFQSSSEEAEILFEKTLQEWKDEYIFGGSLAWAILCILPEITIKESILKASIDLAKRVSEDRFIWSILDRVWQRRDMDSQLRRLFFSQDSK